MVARVSIPPARTIKELPARSCEAYGSISSSKPRVRHSGAAARSGATKSRMLVKPLSSFVSLLLGLLFGSGLIKVSFAVGVRPLFPLLALDATTLERLAPLVCEH